MAGTSELDRLDPDPQRRTLSTGLEVEIVRLKTRQFFRLLKILTHGVGPGIMQANLNFDQDNPGEFAQRLITMVLMSIPDAEQEALWFLASMTRPAGLADKPEKDLTKQEKEDNQKLWDDFNSALNNPELDDLLDIIEAVITQEAPEIQALGKRVASMLKLAARTGADREAKAPDPDPRELNGSAEPSPPSSTSSATSTGGPTSTSSASLSAGSASARKRRVTAATASTSPS